MISDFFEFLLRPPATLRGALAFFLASVVAGLLASLLTLMTRNSLLALVGLVVYLLLVIVTIYLLSLDAAPKVLVPQNEQPPPHRGLIVLVGPGRPGEDPLAQAVRATIDYHRAGAGQTKLEYCWLVTSSGEKGGLPVAQVYEKYCKDNGIAAEIFAVDDPWGVQATYEKVRSIYEVEVPKAGLAEQEVIADITGATTPMSVGMALACGENRPMEYMYGRAKDVASVPRLIRFRRRGRA